VIFEAMQEQDKWERKSRQIIHHELHSKIKAIVDRTQNINGLVQRELSPFVGEKRKHDLNIWGKDIEIFASRLQNIIYLLSDNKFRQYLGSMSPILAYAQDYKNKQPLKWLSLRKEFNDAFRTKWNLQNEKKLWIEYEAENEVEIQFHSQNLSYILDNLCDNAVKYAAIQTPIVARVEEAAHSEKLVISNIGRCLAEEEEYRIFEDKYRGANAQGESGEGFGLSIVRGICELYGIGIKYEAEPYKHRGGFCKHQFTLSFPKRLARKKT
jgi:signal transduction histidine kinase